MDDGLDIKEAAFSPIKQAADSNKNLHYIHLYNEKCATSFSAISIFAE